MTFDRAREIAEAVLWAGDVRHGSLAPSAWAESSGADAWQETDCLARNASDAELSGCLRFLRPESRHVEEVRGKHEVHRVPTLDLGERRLASRDQAVPHELAFEVPAGSRSGNWRFVLPAERDVERIAVAGAPRARVVHERPRLEIAVRVALHAAPGDAALRRIRVRVENRTPVAEGGGERDALRASVVGTHVLLSLSQGEFLPPADSAAGGCASVRTWPVLVDSAGRSHVLLSAPLRLADRLDLDCNAAEACRDSVEIDGVPVARGTRVVLRSARRRGGPRDPHLVDRIARVERVYRSGGDQTCLAVSLLGDSRQVFYLPPDDVIPVSDPE